jgi:DNA (cytosine-5)-methyltransferase 1
MRTVIDLFSGIGGFALGLESTGYFKTVQFVENEKWCQKILNKNFPEIPIHDDVKTFKGYDADVVVGGFPCQPFSVAGKQQAIQDNRHLWPDMFRVIKETKPTWIIGENVRNIVSISEGMVLEQVYLDLESEGYEVQSFIIPASAVNAPHQRYRTWIVAYTEHSRQSSKPIRNIRGLEEKSQKEEGARDQSTICIETRSADVAHTDSKGSQRQRKITIRTYEELENFGNPCWWNTEPNVGRVANGIPNRVDRLKGLGNAIVPQIAYQIGKAIMEAENDNR